MKGDGDLVLLKPGMYLQMNSVSYCMPMGKCAKISTHLSTVFFCGDLNT